MPLRQSRRCWLKYGVFTLKRKLLSICLLQADVYLAALLLLVSHPYPYNHLHRVFFFVNIDVDAVALNTN
jgi:hypothetical protein